jgi:pilus assembly protein CpaE
MSTHLDKQALTSLAISVRPDFDVLLAPSNPVDAEFITGEMCGNVLHLLQGLYDYIVVDSSPAFTDVVLESFDSADVHVLLTTLDIPTIKNMRVALSTMDELDLPRSKRVLVVNHSDLSTGVSVDDVERSLGMPVTVRIPSSDAVPNSINRGVTLVQSEPKHAISRAIEELAAQVTGHERTAAAPSKRSIFGRRKQEAGL